MSKYYKISIYAMGNHDDVEITKDDFEILKRTRELILFGLAIEEKLDLLAENYADLERELIDMAMQHCIFPGAIEELLSESRHIINRRIINLLTSIRLYHDQVAHAISSVYGKKSSVLAEFRTHTHMEYDSKLSYRAMEALRNHVQHASLPITAISFPMTTVESDNNNSNSEKSHKLSYKVIPYIGIESLEKNKEFKKAVLEELKLAVDSKNGLKVVPIVREYISSIGCIHNKLRLMCNPELETAVETLEKYRNIAPEISEGLAAIEYTKDNLYTDHIYLTDRAVKRWRNFLSKNKYLEHVSKKYVSSEHD